MPRESQTCTKAACQRIITIQHGINSLVIFVEPGVFAGDRYSFELQSHTDVNRERRKHNLQKTNKQTETLLSNRRKPPVNVQPAARAIKNLRITINIYVY